MENLLNGIKLLKEEIKRNKSLNRFITVERLEKALVEFEKVIWEVE